MPALKTINEPLGAGHFLSGQFDYNRNAEQVTLAATGVDLDAGRVLGKVAATGLYVPINFAANDGSQNFAGILYDRRKASAAQQRAVTVERGATVNGNALGYPAGATGPQIAACEAQMKAAGVIVRR
ncbi:MAG: head decoration protein [Sphingomonas sp.]|nr:head decoration protein [Sphingomonas sp.]